MTRRTLLAALLLGSGAARAERRKDKRSNEERKAKALRGLLQRLRKLRAESPSIPEQATIHSYAESLLDEAKGANAGSYLIGRLFCAADGLLDSSEELDELKRSKPIEKDTREKAARDLTNAYFRVKQGDYYASAAKHPWAPELVPLSQRFYQIARREYDAGANTRARHYAEAARELISALECLAQAAVRVPEPPPL